MAIPLELPSRIPVMTLADTVFFPQALLPLHIFEPRYRQMLKDVLRRNRIFAVANLDPALGATPGAFEPAHRIATAGIVRLCQDNGNGTANLILQGICRIELLQVVREEPFRSVEIRAIPANPVTASQELNGLKKQLERLFALKHKLGWTVPAEVSDLLSRVQDPDVFVDLAAFNLCEDSRMKQRLLETLCVVRRFTLLIRQVKREIEQIKFQRKLQGGLNEEEIGGN